MHLIREQRLRDNAVGRVSSPRWMPKEHRPSLDQLERKSRTSPHLLTLDDRMSLRDMYQKQESGFFGCIRRCFTAPPTPAEAFKEELIRRPSGSFDAKFDAPYPVSESTPRRRSRADLM
jgi:hypothetical protein